MLKQQSGRRPSSGVAPLSLIATLFGTHWRWATLLVVIGVFILIRLGFWQLDRLEQRRARNAQLSHQLSLLPLALTGESLSIEAAELKNRLAMAEGYFDYEQQVTLKLQNLRASDGFISPLQSVGVDIITPFVIEGSQTAVLVNRGWVSEGDSANLAHFDEAIGPTTVTGRIQLSEILPPDREPAPPSMPQAEWYRVDVEAIAAQMPYELLPIFIEQLPSEQNPTGLPYRQAQTYDLSEGPHLGYAMQWFAFALIFGGGYLYYVWKSLSAPGTE